MIDRDQPLPAPRGKLFGACAGLAARGGLDVTLLRVAAILLVAGIGFKLAVVAYCAVAVALRLTRD